MTIMIVDGYNAIYAIPSVRERLKVSLQAAREAIVDLSIEYVKRSGYIDDVKVVFDGDERFNGAHSGFIPKRSKIIFSSKNKGDDKIIETIKRCRSELGRINIVAVSNDNYIRNNARAYGASILSSEELTRSRKGSKKYDISARKHKKSIMQNITFEYRKELGIR